MTEISDDRLIEGSGERPELFEEVFVRHWPAVAGYLLRRVGRDVGEDLAGEVFVRAFAARGRYVGGDGDARPWLFGFVARVVAEHRRRERRQLRALSRGLGEGRSGDEAYDAIVRADAAVAAEPVLERLRRLPLSHRETVLLWVWGELSYEQIASALGVPVGTVRSRISRARGRLAAEEVVDCPLPTPVAVEGAHA